MITVKQMKEFLADKDDSAIFVCELNPTLVITDAVPDFCWLPRKNPDGTFNEDDVEAGTKPCIALTMAPITEAR